MNRTDRANVTSDLIYVLRLPACLRKVRLYGQLYCCQTMLLLYNQYELCLLPTFSCILSLMFTMCLLAILYSCYVQMLNDPLW